MDETKSIFDLEEFKHLRSEFYARQNRFAKNWQYYKAEFTSAFTFATDTGRYVGSQLTNSVKPLFTPLARAVELDVALVPGDWPLNPNYQNARPFVEQIFEASKWDIEGDVFVRYVTAMGEGGLRVVDDRINNRVIVQPVRPEQYLVVPKSRWDSSPAVAIFVWKEGESEMAEVITGTTIRTFKNGMPFAMSLDRPAVYTNQLGFVPLVVCQLDAGDGTGEPTFENALVALDQVNRQATYMAQIISRHAEPQWAVIGAEEGDLEKSGEAVWFFPEGSDLKAVLAAVDFEGLLAFIKEIKEEMKESLPELALSKLVGVERVAAATIELQMAEAVFKIKRLRKPIDLAVCEALKLAAAAGAEMGIAGASEVKTGGVKFDKNRPVITVDALTRIQIEQATRSSEMSKIALEKEQMLIAATQGKEGANK